MSAKKILLGVLGLLLLGLLGLGLVVFVVLPRFVEAEVVREARARGVELVPGRIEFGLGWVRVKDAKLSLIGVRGLAIHVDAIDAELEGFAPKAFALSQVKARAEGEVPTLLSELLAWVRAHEGDLREPVLAAPIAFELLGAASPENTENNAWLALEGGELRVADERRLLTVKRARVRGQELGEARVLVAKERTRIDLTLGESALENPLVAIDLESSPSERRVNVALSPVSLVRLGALFGVTTSFGRNVTASGTFTARVPEALALGAAIDGSVDMALKGYIPPHPVELDGFVFGDTTSFATRYRLEPERLRAELSGTRVKAGAFTLSGSGLFEASLPEFALGLLLSGALPCNTLASAAAQTRLGQALGKVTGKAALQTLSGSVGVRVSVQATSANLANPRVLKTISPGCGLKPLSFAELVKLGELLPEALDPKVAQDFQELMRKTLPGLPSVPGVNAPLTVPKITLPPPVLPAPTLPVFRGGPRSDSPAPRSQGSEDAPAPASSN